MAERGLRALIAEDGHALPGGVDERLQRMRNMLERTDRQMKRLERLIADLLDVSRIAAGKLEMRPARCDLCDIVREAVEEQQAAWPARAITLDLPRHGPLAVEADADRIGQVVTNYLTNALKYSDGNEPVAVAVRVRGANARVAVRDHGPGLTRAQREHLWEEFYRVPEITARSGSGVGLGLGLYLCRTIVERHGGQVGLETHPGDGSAFWFTLPLAEDTAPGGNTDEG
jgi:signal transduction histidine kinase